MDLKKPSGGSNVVSFRRPKRESSTSTPLNSDLTAQGLALLHAFLKITSPEDRDKIVELAQRLSQASCPNQT
jgi:hypothetical protein